MAAARVSDLHRTAFLTGASTGLGRAFAEMLLAEGVRVCGTSRDPARLDDLVRAHPGAFTAAALDLRDGDAAVRTFREREAAAGGFDLVINNAGYGAFGPFAGTDFAPWRRQLEVMLVNTAQLTHAALPGLLARGHGALVNISSLAAEFPLPYQSAYNMTKAGLSALSESLMIETDGTGVVVIDFRPGDYRTDFEPSVERLPGADAPRPARVWAAFAAMMRSGPAPAHAAAALRRALRRHRSGTVRTGRPFQAILGPFLVRFIPRALARRIEARYFDAG